jgi:hypothetical protein
MEKCCHHSGSQNENPIYARDFRPISVTSILSRKLERHIVAEHIYPAMNVPPPEISFDDQFAFQPTGTAALINLIGILTQLLRSGKIVVLISLDF